MRTEINLTETQVPDISFIIKGGGQHHKINTHRGNPRSGHHGKGLEAFFRDLEWMPRYHRFKKF